MVSFGALASKFLGNSNNKKLKAYQNKVSEINDLEPEMAALSDDELKNKTTFFQSELKKGKSLYDILVPAFATVREAAKRTLGLRHFDVQLIGGMVLNDARISEMRTGEGKTLVATLAVYLNALNGKGVHVVTVNDYLAQRDAKWMGQIYEFLGLTVGCIIHGLAPEERKAQYDADITYGTNNEFGFDYLRDNMEYSLDNMSQRGHAFAIIDEVDSILIDEARTPLIISGPIEDKTELYIAVDKLIPLLKEEDFEVNEKDHAATLTEQGIDNMEELLSETDLMEGSSLYDTENVTLVHHINQALKAHKLFRKDKDYIVKNNEVVIIDEFTGRMMEGRRYSEGLHQAIEAKENCDIKPENQTLASITFQNYFRMYDKLAGMTGTALTEAEEFMDIYGLDVISIPTNLPVARIDEDDVIYLTAAEKYKAIIELVKECYKKKQPVLVGTTSIEKSELIAELFKKAKIPHNVLNARYHAQEAQIVSQAGAPGAVTIATNMAGRGTDIKLGGNAESKIEAETENIDNEDKKKEIIAKIHADIEAKQKVALEAGGLYIIGTERHESRRIDNQLRGRSGRQGDPGSSKFFLSLEDDLMRIFGSERMSSMLQKLGIKEDEAIIHPWINKAIEKAQRKVEAKNFDIRKNILKFDDVMNDQRKIIFEQRIEIMGDMEVNETITDMRYDIIDNIVENNIPKKSYAEQWDIEHLHEDVNSILNLDLPIEKWATEEGIADEEIKQRLIKASDDKFQELSEQIGLELFEQIGKESLLRTIDKLWREHLMNLDHLRQSVGLRGYAQRDPINEYKTEGFALFANMITNLRSEVTQQLSNITIEDADINSFESELELPDFSVSHIDPFTGLNDVLDNETKFSPENPSSWGKISRNSPCPCGSGKKYKHCHGSL